jgi:hypothetical protein
VEMEVKPEEKARKSRKGMWYGKKKQEKKAR